MIGLLPNYGTVVIKYLYKIQQYTLTNNVVCFYSGGDRSRLNMAPSGEKESRSLKSGHIRHLSKSASDLTRPASTATPTEGEVRASSAGTSSTSGSGRPVQAISAGSVAHVGIAPPPPKQSFFSTLKVRQAVIIMKR